MNTSALVRATGIGLVLQIVMVVAGHFVPAIAGLFAVGGMGFSALAGWLYAYQRAYVGTDMFESYFLVLMLTAIVIVGRRMILGPLVGTALIIVQQNFFSIGGDGDKIVLGAVLAAILLLWPKGLVGVWDLFASRRTQAVRHRS